MSKKKHNETFNYEDYLKSSHWKKVKTAYRKKYVWECVMCHGAAHALHHQTYKHLGKEHKYLEDLVSLCKSCHTAVHDRESGNLWVVDEDNKVKRTDKQIKKNFKSTKITLKGEITRPTKQRRKKSPKTTCNNLCECGSNGSFTKRDTCYKCGKAITR